MNDKSIRTLLVIRLSSAGDVAMTVPVLSSFQKAYPDTRLVILTRKSWAPLFDGLKASLILPELQGRHKGLTGLIRLYREISRNHPVDAVADLHNVTRSRILSLLFSVGGTRIAVIDKGRSEKKKLTRQKEKQLVALTSGFDRYRQVFVNLGFSFDLDFKCLFTAVPPLPEGLPERKGRWIGVAPFAAFPMKVYPESYMKQIIATLTLRGDTVFLFGSAEERSTLADWEKEFGSVYNLAGRYSLSEELAIMNHLDLMLAMDSANMHFAALAGTRVVSIWGATHPFAGFAPWNQEAADMIQTDLSCRPCSVYGNKACFRNDHACMTELEPARVLQRMEPQA